MPPLIFGVAFGNLLQGVPFHFDNFMVVTYTGTFWQLLNPFAILTGVVSSAMITMHGGTHFRPPTEGAIQQRAPKATGAAIIAVVASDRLRRVAARGQHRRLRHHPAIDSSRACQPDGELSPWHARPMHGGATIRKQLLLWALPAIGVTGPLLAVVLARVGRTLAAFVLSSLGLRRASSRRPGLRGARSCCRRPACPAPGLTVWDSVSSHAFTLGLRCSGRRSSSRPSSLPTQAGATA
ncbi:cytochrome d ubiquinol oxidase subunit II [Cupriavidus basilensis]